MNVLQVYDDHIDKRHWGEMESESEESEEEESEEEKDEEDIAAGMAYDCAGCLISRSFYLTISNTTQVSSLLPTRV